MAPDAVLSRVSKDDGVGYQDMLGEKQAPGRLDVWELAPRLQAGRVLSKQMQVNVPQHGWVGRECWQVAVVLGLSRR
jgi:hypothetical protein